MGGVLRGIVVVCAVMAAVTVLLPASSVAAAQATGSGQAAAVVQTSGIGGRVVDAETKRALPDVTLRIVDDGDVVGSTIADDSGSYLLGDLDPGLYAVIAELAGYQTASQTEVRVRRARITQVDFELARAGAIAEDVVVTAKLSADDPRAPVTSFALSREEIRRSPGTAGDILRAMDTLPGTTATGEFSSFQVRGRGPRDNLILVDNIPFDKVTHFDQSIGEGEDVAGGGRFSIFAPNLIQDAEFLPGGFPAAYGGKNGSLLRLTVAEGNRNTAVVSGRAEITGWEINYDGPLRLLDDTTALFSARGQYFGPLLELVGQKGIGSPTLYDVIGKTTTEISARHKVSVLGIFAPERFERTVENVLAGRAVENSDETSTFLAMTRQDNVLLGGTSRRLLGTDAYVDNTFYFRYTDKSSRQGDSFPDQAPGDPPAPEDVPVREDILAVNEGEREWGWRGDYNLLAGETGAVAAGARLTRLSLDYDVALDGPWINYVYDGDDSRPDPDRKFIVLRPELIDSSFKSNAWRPAAYGEFAFNVGERLTLTPGARYDYDGFSAESLVSPRFSASFAAGPRTRLNFATGVFYQYPRFIELAANPSNAGLRSEKSTQVVLGASHYLSRDVRFMAEAYYHWLDDLVIVPDRTTNVAANAGNGYSWGVDLALVKRITTDWFAQLAYSYAVSTRDDRQGGGPYDADFNRPNVFSAFLAYEVTSNFQIGTKWKYMSGRPTDDFIVNADVFGNPDFLRFSKEITAVNVRRFPAYHTLNVRGDYRIGVGPLGLVVFVDFFNVYNHKNVNSLEFDPLTGNTRQEGLEAFPTFGIKFEY